MLPKDEILVELQTGDNGLPLILKTVNPYTIKYEYFRKVFNKNFGFAGPYSDRCSACMRLKIQISQDKDQEKKEQLESKL